MGIRSGQGGNHSHAQWRVPRGAHREWEPSGEPALHLRQLAGDFPRHLSSQLPRMLLFKVSKPRKTGGCLHTIPIPNLRPTLPAERPSESRLAQRRVPSGWSQRAAIITISIVLTKTPLPEYRLVTLHPRWA